MVILYIVICGVIFMKKLLITGFEPFGGENYNPSWEAVTQLSDSIGDFELTKLRLPVVFGEAQLILADAADTLKPDIILSVGLAGGRDAVTPEFVAINLRHASIPDNVGNQPTDEAIIKDGNAAYFSTVNPRKMVDAIKQCGIPVKPSYTAGTYVCNEVLYSMLARFDGTNTRVGFIHLPFVPEQAKPGVPSLNLSDMINALTAAIKSIE